MRKKNKVLLGRRHVFNRARFPLRDSITDVIVSPALLRSLVRLRYAREPVLHCGCEQHACGAEFAWQRLPYFSIASVTGLAIPWNIAPDW